MGLRPFYFSTDDGTAASDEFAVGLDLIDFESGQRKVTVSDRFGREEFLKGGLDGLDYMVDAGFDFLDSVKKRVVVGTIGDLR